MGKKVNMNKIVGIALILAGLLVVFAPEYLPTGFVGSLGGQQSTYTFDYEGTKTGQYKIYNDYVTASTPFTIEVTTPYLWNRPDVYVTKQWNKFFINGKQIGGIYDGRACGPTVSCPTCTCSFSSIPNISIPYNAFETAGISSGKHLMEVWQYTDRFNASAGVPPDAKQDKTRYSRAFDVEVWVDAKGCELTENEMVVAETFSAGRTVSKADLRFPVKGFCASLPILVTQSGENVAQLIEEYSFIDKSYVTIPTGQTWTIFYIADVSPDVAVVCQDGVYDALLSECVVSPPIVFSCSGDAIFDSEQQLCISQAETRIVCDLQDATYDVVKGECIKIVPTELQAETFCPEGSTVVISSDGDIKKCIFEAEAATEWVCETGHLNTSVDPPVCLKQAQTEYTEIELPVAKATGKETDITIIIIGFIIVIAGVALLIRS